MRADAHTCIPLLIVAVNCLFTVQAGATDGGGYAGAFLRMGIGPRAQALGDAYTAVGEGANAGFYNPAGVAVVSSRQFMASLSLLSLDRSFYLVSYVQPMRPKGKGAINGGFSLGWLHAGVGDIDGRDLSGNSIGTFSNSENAFYLSFALYPHRILSIGVSGKIIYNVFPSVKMDDSALTSSGFGIDAGILLMPLKGLRIGAAVRDINSKYTWNTENVWETGSSEVNRFPLLFRWGAAYALPGNWLFLCADMEHSKEQKLRSHLGLEGIYKKKYMVRLGVDEGKLRFGLGVAFEFLGRYTGFDYAYLSSLEGLHADHVFAWTFSF